jgi:integrase
VSRRRARRRQRVPKIDVVVTMGIRDDGRPHRRHMQSSSRAEVTRRLRELEKQRDSSRVRRPDDRGRSSSGSRTWSSTSPPVRLGEHISSYRVAVRVHLIPGLGAHRLDRLQPEHLEWL